MIFNGYSIGQQKRITLVNCWKRFVLVYSYKYKLIKSYNTALNIYSTMLSLVALGKIMWYISSIFIFVVVAKIDIISFKKIHLHTHKTELQMFRILIKIHIEYR